VSWEHAAIERGAKHRWILHNLAATGTTVNVVSATVPIRLAHDDEIALSPSCRLRVEMLRPDGRPIRPASNAVPVAVVVVLAALGGAWFLMRPQPAPRRASADAMMRTAYASLYDTVQGWERTGRVPPATADTLAEAWRLESGSPVEAATRYCTLWARLRAWPLKGFAGTHGEQTLTELYSADSTNLARLARGQTLNEDEELDALLRFVIKGMERTGSPGGRS